jgi:chemotaxis response regulator CheB
MRIGVVNDRPATAAALAQALALEPGHRTIWTARSGLEAVELCASDTPDLVLMALLGPPVVGVEATRRIMSRTPCPILITVSGGADAARVFEAMGHGALDVVDAPEVDCDSGRRRNGAAPLLAKIATIARLVGHRDVSPRYARMTRDDGRRPLVVVGASAGGPAAVATVLLRLPRDLPAAIVIVQHVEAQFAAGMAEWLGLHSALPVRIAAEGDRLTPGTVFLAGTTDHLHLLAGGRLGYTPEPRECAYRPSIDVFFRSVGRRWKGDVVGILLTGMGSDGAVGLKALRDLGHHTIAQDEASSAVFGMPKAAAAMGAAVEVLPIERLAERLAELLRARPGYQVLASRRVTG